ncbi:MAG: hypothetical protein JWP97_2004, partial [Labilithrix sp.]|nr:hypothetical protein [Labilithrix sp.]
ADGGGADGGGSGDGGIIDDPDGNPVGETGAVTLEGGGISCNAAPASTSSLMTLAGLGAIVAAFVRRRRR